MSPILGSELLRGEHVRLTGVQCEDLPLMAQMWSEIGYLRHLMRRMAIPTSLNDMEDWFKHMRDENSPTFAIRLLDGDQFIGVCAFKDVRWVARHSFFWIGIGDPQMRGKGYGTDATRVLLRYGFMEMNLNCIALEVFSYNEPALKSYQKIGFKADGVVRAYIARDGQYFDMHLMSMLREEWEARYRTNT